MHQLTLFPTFTVHCFWDWCDHTVTTPNPYQSHDAMEAHYREQHRADLDRAIAYVRGMRVYE